MLVLLRLLALLISCESGKYEFFASLTLRRMFRYICLYFCMFPLASLLSSIVLRILFILSLYFSLCILVPFQRYYGYYFG